MKNQQDIARMKELIATLSPAARAYYQESREIMSNFDYDRLYDELAALEAKTGLILTGSPTQNVGYEVVSSLPKERHEKPMLSLNKTKSVEELQEWLGDQKGLLSWKMDDKCNIINIIISFANKTINHCNTKIYSFV